MDLIVGVVFLLFASFSEIPIVECGDGIIDLREQTQIAYRATTAQRCKECTKVRKRVYEMIVEAEKLMPDGIRFEVNVGLRSLKVQSRLFDKLYHQMKEEFPEMGEQELFDKVSKFVSPLRTKEGVINIPPHSTGGAIDIHLLDKEGRPIDMGVIRDNPLFDPPELMRMDSPYICEEARKYREIMAAALSAVGFVNYPAEFWHWSYGDQRWAFERGAEYAIYGPVDAE